MTKLSAYWSSCEVVRQEIMLLRSKYAVALKSDGKTLHTQVTILFNQACAKTVVDFSLTGKQIEEWPQSIERVAVQVENAYVLEEQASIRYNIDSCSIAWY